MEQRPKKLADYVAVTISPILIMLLVGSLAFFLIQVFYRGDLVQGVRWTMFWFVVAIVLISRIGIQRGKLQARCYAAALAMTAWIYLAYTHKAPVVGAILLAITWACAHWLTIDCTLIREGETDPRDSWLQKLWQTLGKQFATPEPLIPPRPMSALEMLAAAELASRRPPKPARPPGRSVVWFSLAALPLFGIGQLFLPAENARARHAGFVFLALYLGAAFSLLVTTSLLGLRQYLRQRSVSIPPSVTIAWIKFGSLLAGGVLLLALILPRPGALTAWKNLAYQIVHKEHKANDYAPPFNAPGQGEGLRTEQPSQRTEPGVDSRKRQPGGGAGNARNDNPAHSNPRTPSNQPGADGGGKGKGGQGSSGQGDRSDDDHPGTGRTITLKDVTPSGNADQPSDNKPSGGSDGGDGAGHDGGGHPPAKINPILKPSQPGKETPRKESPQLPPPTLKTKPSDQPQPPPPPQQKHNGQGQQQPSDFLHRLLRWLLILAVMAVLIWLLVRYRKVIADMIRSSAAAVRDFLRKLLKLFRFRPRQPVPAPAAPVPAMESEPFATYANPFTSGKDRIWPQERLLRYTYEALQTWAQEQGIALKPQQTPREFCFQLIERFPEIGLELEQFAIYYSHVAFAKRLPDEFETESIRRLWEHLGEAVMA